MTVRRLGDHGVGLFALLSRGGAIWGVRARHASTSPSSSRGAAYLVIALTVLLRDPGDLRAAPARAGPHAGVLR
jgi:hypothetical protein